MAAITGCPCTDEGRLPLGHETPVALDDHQPIEEGVHQPKAAVAPSQVVAHPITGPLWWHDRARKAMSCSP